MEHRSGRWHPSTGLAIYTRRVVRKESAFGRPRAGLHNLSNGRMGCYLTPHGFLCA